jgi:hypothetical protein
MDQENKYCILFGGYKYLLYAGIHIHNNKANYLILNELAVTI